MAGIQDVQIGQRCSFEVYPIAVLGSNFRDVMLDAIVSPQAAAIYGYDIQALHANVYPTLPAGTVPNDPFQYNYVRIRFPSGEYALLGIPWIRSETVVISTGGTVTMIFQNKTSVDIDRMLLALSSNGYKPDKITVEST